MDESPKTSKPARYYVAHSNEVQGPYDLEFIEAMVLSNIYPPGVLICREGSQNWSPLPGVRPTALPAQLPSQPQNTTRTPLPLNTPTFRVPTPTPPKSKISGGLIFTIAVIVIALVSVLNNSTPKPKAAAYSPSTVSTPYPTTYSTPYSTPYSQTVTAWVPPRQYYAVSTPTPHYASFNGQTYRVSDSDNRFLEQRQSLIEAGATDLAQARANAKELGNEIELERAILDRTSDYAVDNFNAKVNRYNAAEAALESQIQQYNSMVDSYNAELVRVGTPVR